MSDKLDEMFMKRRDFMLSLKDKKPTEYPDWPINLSSKQDQQHVRDMALRGVEEMFEALQHLKNWKPHKFTEDLQFDKEEFNEEMIDAFNYFLSIFILLGVNSDEFYKAYIRSR